MIGRIFRLATAALTLAVVAVAIGLGFIWYDGSRMVGRAEASGWLTPAPDETPLSLFEATVAKGIFGRTWDQGGFPCRTAARFWNYYFGDRSSPPGGMSISQILARDISYQVEASQSLGSQVRQLSLACQLEGKHSDSDLLRLWIRRANFGRGLVGPETAAQETFGKPTSALGPAESARLAALLSEPGLRTNPDQWSARARKIAQLANPD